MSGELAGKVALITGSSRGFGEAIARRLADDGAMVIVNSSSSAVAGRRVAREISENGGNAVYLRADVSSPREVKEMVDAIRQRFGHLDILVHNAASGSESDILLADREQLDRAIGANTTAVLMLTQALRDLIRAGGRIIYVSSFGAKIATPGYGIVGIAKAATEALVRSLAFELAPDITVNTVRAPVLDTASLRYFSRGVQYLRTFDEESLTGRVDLADAAEALSLFVSPRARIITGQVIELDGGWGTSLRRRMFEKEDAL